MVDQQHVRGFSVAFSDRFSKKSDLCELEFRRYFRDFVWLSSTDADDVSVRSPITKSMTYGFAGKYVQMLSINK